MIHWPKFWPLSILSTLHCFWYCFKARLRKPNGLLVDSSYCCGAATKTIRFFQISGLLQELLQSKIYSMEKYVQNIPLLSFCLCRSTLVLPYSGLVARSCRQALDRAGLVATGAGVLSLFLTLPVAGRPETPALSARCFHLGPRPQVGGKPGRQGK